SKVSSAEPSANLYVYVGSSDLGKMTKFLVKTVTPHEMYNFITTENDIAILTLASPITFNACTKPIPLVNATTELLDEDCKVMGWGVTTDSEKDAGPSTLKYATVFIHNEYKCQDLFRNKLPNLPSSIFCAKGRGGSDVCR
ncbi:serine protease 55, partial [Biomphalaria glabrata]